MYGVKYPSLLSQASRKSAPVPYTHSTGGKAPRRVPPTVSAHWQVMKKIGVTFLNDLSLVFYCCECSRNEETDASYSQL